MIKLQKGLDLPISGEPRHVIHDSPKVKSVAVLGEDFVGMKPTMMVKVGDQVKKGQVLFNDKKNEGVCFTAPASGTVSAINRGPKRVLQSVVVDVSGDESVQFKKYSESDLTSLSPEDVESNLIESGMWQSFRTRPFSKSPVKGSRPAALFVTAIDTNPLAANAAFVINHYADAFKAGLTIISKLTSGTMHVCTAPEPRLELPVVANLKETSFSGPHPAGLAGTHIHFLEPVTVDRVVWTIGYADVIGIGKLFLTGELFTERLISIAGPMVEHPRLYKTRIGANTDELLAGLLTSGEARVVSGSLFSGHKAAGPHAYLGFFHSQISVIEEGRKRELLGWKMPGFDKFSVKRSYAGGWFPWKKFDMTSSTGGSERSIVPIGMYEKVLPIDTEATFLVRSLLTRDSDLGVALGILDMDEEDVGLLSFVCPGKNEYGPMLREVLSSIERDG